MHITRHQENITMPFPRPLLTHILFYVSRAGLARLHHPSPCDLKISTILASSGSAADSTAPPKPSPPPTNTLPSTHTWRAFRTRRARGRRGGKNIIGYYHIYFYFYFSTLARIISLTLLLPPLVSIFTKARRLPWQQHGWEGWGEGGGGGSGFV